MNELDGDAAGALQALGHWARALRIGDVPPDVLAAARHQLAHVDARAKQTPDLGLPASNALPSAVYAAFDGDGHVLGARTGVGIAALRSLDPAGITVERALLATVIGTEIGARIGLATLLSNRATRSSARPGAAAGAAAIAWLGEASGDAIGHAVANAVGLAARCDATGTAVGTAVAEAAIGAVSGGDQGLQGGWSDVVVPVPGALAPGGRWLSRVLVLPTLCVPPQLATAVEGLNEILKRHMKAAEKRLRPEQIDRVEVRVTFPAWAAEQHQPRIAEMLGRLVAFHALGPAERASSTMVTEGVAVDRAAEIAAVAERVTVVHDWALSAGLVRSATPWTGAVTWQRYRALRAALKPAGAWPTWKPGDLWPLALARPDALLGAPGPADGPLEWPVQVKLYTTRGGWWPERRRLAEGLVTADAPPQPFDRALAESAAPLLGRP